MELVKNEAITETGLHISMPVPGIIRVTDGNHRDSYMVSARLRKSAPKVEGGRLSWGRIAIEPENHMALYFDGKLLCADYAGQRVQQVELTTEEQELLIAEGHSINNAEGDWAVEVLKVLNPDDAIYGLGDKTGYLNKRHYAYENWCTDDPAPHVDCFKSLYKSINFFIIATENGCCGILADNTYRTAFDFGKECDDYIRFAHADGALDYYMIPGKDIKEVLRKYTALTGQGGVLAQDFLDVLAGDHVVIQRTVGMGEADVIVTLLAKVEGGAVGVVRQNAAAAVLRGDDEEVDGLVQALEAVHMGCGVIGAPVLVGVVALVQVAGLVAQTVDGVIGIQNLQNLHRPVALGVVDGVTLGDEQLLLLGGQLHLLYPLACVVGAQELAVKIQRHVVFGLNGDPAPAQASALNFGRGLAQTGADHVAVPVIAVGDPDDAGDGHGNMQTGFGNGFIFDQLHGKSSCNSMSFPRVPGDVLYSCHCSLAEEIVHFK